MLTWPVEHDLVNGVRTQFVSPLVISCVDIMPGAHPADLCIITHWFAAPTRNSQSATRILVIKLKVLERETRAGLQFLHVLPTCEALHGMSLG